MTNTRFCVLGVDYDQGRSRRRPRPRPRKIWPCEAQFAMVSRTKTLTRTSTNQVSDFAFRVACLAIFFVLLAKSKFVKHFSMRFRGRGRSLKHITILWRLFSVLCLLFPGT